MKAERITADDREIYENLQITPTCSFELWDKELKSMIECGAPAVYKCGTKTIGPKWERARKRLFVCEEHKR